MQFFEFLCDRCFRFSLLVPGFAELRGAIGSASAQQLYQKKGVHPFTRAGGWGFTAKIVVMNGSQRCELHNLAYCRWVGWEWSVCRVLLLPFWSRATLRSIFKNLPPTQRCIDSVYSGVRVRSEALQLSSFIKKKEYILSPGRAGGVSLQRLCDSFFQKFSGPFPACSP